ncbi:MAG TPA: WecB/TagA/CpsF family glycosyltransferase [Bryobacteraceae bacterium]|nr:WecB/TagA/CpsF family glycosyltransferase [Bryobacteraceae bacterium]
MTALKKQRVLGVGVTATSYSEVCALSNQWIQQSREPDGGQAPQAGRYICVTSVHGIMAARSNPVFRRILNEADLVTPDGMPVVWAMRSFGCRAQTRVYGPTLMLALCAQAERRRHRIFLYGARRDTLQALQRNLLVRFPDLQIVGWYAPPFRPLTRQEDARVTGRVRASKAELVFVGISTPKQEAWMSAHKATLPGVVMLGVGAAFDFHSGRVRQAPAWMQRSGLEWFYRLLMEPRRLWRRYLLQTPLFLPLWWLQLSAMLWDRYRQRNSPVADGACPEGWT